MSGNKNKDQQSSGNRNSRRSATKTSPNTNNTTMTNSNPRPPKVNNNVPVNAQEFFKSNLQTYTERVKMEKTGLAVFEGADNQGKDQGPSAEALMTYFAKVDSDTDEVFGILYCYKKTFFESRGPGFVGMNNKDYTFWYDGVINFHMEGAQDLADADLPMNETLVVRCFCLTRLQNCLDVFRMFPEKLSASAAIPFFLGHKEMVRVIESQMQDVVIIRKLGMNAYGKIKNYSAMSLYNFLESPNPRIVKMTKEEFEGVYKIVMVVKNFCKVDFQVEPKTLKELMKVVNIAWRKEFAPLKTSTSVEDTFEFKFDKNFNLNISDLLK